MTTPQTEYSPITSEDSTPTGAVVAYDDENALSGGQETNIDEPLKTPAISLKTTPELFALYHLHIKDYKEGLTALELLASAELAQRVTKILADTQAQGVPQGRIIYDVANLPQVMAQTNIKGLKIQCQLSGVVESDLSLLDDLIKLFGSVPFQQIDHPHVVISPCFLYQESLDYEPVANEFVAFLTHVDGFNFWLVKQLMAFKKQLKKHKDDRGAQPIIHHAKERKSPSDSQIEPLAFVINEEKLPVSYRNKIVYVDKPEFADIPKLEPVRGCDVDFEFRWINYEYAVFIFAKYQGNFEKMMETC